MTIVTQNINHQLVSRLRTQMLRKGLNPKTLAERAKVGRSFVYDILSGKSTNPTSTKIAAIAEELGVSVQYLLSGIHSNLGPKQQEWSDIIEVSSLKVEPTLGGSTVVTVEQENKPYYFRREWVREKLGVRTESLRAITITGDSMDPTLISGDAVLIDLTRQIPNPAGIFVVFDGVGLVCKRLEMISPERINVLSDNNRYSSHEAQLSEISIIGKVVWLARELKV